MSEKTAAGHRPDDDPEDARTAPRKKTSLPSKAVLIIAAVTVVLLFCALIYHFGFVISQVTVVGNSAYRSEEIVLASGIVPGETRLYSFNALTAAKTVCRKLPRIASMTVRRSAPSTVTITVEEDSPVYVAELYGKARALSAGLRVLEETETASAVPNGLKRLLLPKVRSAVAGEQLTFYDDRERRVVDSVLSDVEKSEIADHVTGIDVREIFSVRFIVDELYLVEAGSAEETEKALRAVAALLRSKDFQQYGEVKLRIIVPEKGAITILPNAGMDLYE